MVAVALLSRPQAAGFTAVLSESQFILYCLLIQSLLMKSVWTINCSEPTSDALLAALKESLLYKNDVRPVYYQNTPTNISLSFTLYGILGVDEKAQIFDSFIWVYLFWNIEGLSWDPVECGTDRISLPRKKLWMPDVVINEFMDESKSPDTYYLYVEQNGWVMDDRPVHVISSCNMDIYTFPFDIQNCTFTFNSYRLTARDLQLFFVEPAETTLEGSLSVMKTKGEWELVDMLAEKPPIPPEELKDTYDTLIYHIILSRRPTMYVVNLLIPSCFLITVDLLSFLLPPQNVDRSAFKMTLIFGYTVFLLLMNDLLPVTGNSLPLISLYRSFVVPFQCVLTGLVKYAFFSLCFALMVASLLETIFIANIQCGSVYYGPLPQWAKTFFLIYVAKLVCLSKKPSNQNCDPEERQTETKSCDPAVEAPHRKVIHKTPTLLELQKISHELLSIRQQVENYLTADLSTDEWIHLGQVIDRLFFCLYVVFLSVSFITILIFWVCWYKKSASLI